jgi:hypothetical protein
MIHVEKGVRVGDEREEDSRSSARTRFTIRGAFPKTGSPGQGGVESTRKSREYHPVEYLMGPYR